MRIALIADIHGNRIALDAILDDVTAERVDQIICLGDVVAFGPQPAEVVARLRDLGSPVVMGNTDASLLWPEAPATDETLRRLQDIERWARERLTASDRNFVGSFPSTLEVALARNVSLLCYHGSPRSFKDRIMAISSADELDRMLDGAVAQVYAGGHTHVQMVRRHRDALVLNPGSVGLAYDRVPAPDLPAAAVRNPPWGEYAILTVAGGRLSLDLRRVPFDVRALLQSAHDNDMPHADWWCAEWDETL
jgi:predicted phosphodiesterase